MIKKLKPGSVFGAVAGIEDRAYCYVKSLKMCKVGKIPVQYIQ
jgi:hypothetical protein